MKRPEYVAAAVAACMAARAGETPDLFALRAVFSRSGFTDGYLTGRRTLDMFGVRTQEDAAAAAPVLGSIRRLYRAERPRVGLDLRLDGAAVPPRLLAGDGVHTVSAAAPDAPAAPGRAAGAAGPRPPQHGEAGRHAVFSCARWSLRAMRRRLARRRSTPCGARRSTRCSRCADALRR